MADTTTVKPNNNKKPGLPNKGGAQLEQVLADSPDSNQQPPTIVDPPQPPPHPTLEVKTDIRREYVSSGGYSWIASYFRSLPTYIDDLTTDFGDDLYERMLYDAQVASAVNTIKYAILTNGVILTNPIKDQESPEFQEAQEILEFCQRNLDRLPTPFESFCWSILDGLATGYKVAEQTYELIEDPADGDNGRLMLKCLKVKPRKSTALVVDAYFNVVALLGLLPGQGASTIMTQGLIGISGSPGEAKFIPANLLPREKFVIFSFKPKDSDPRGTSILRPAYTPWWNKMQTWGEYLKYLVQFASPMIVGTTGENAQVMPVVDALGNPDPSGAVVYPEQALVTSLQALRNGAVIGLPYGSTVTALSPQGNGEAFLEAIKVFNAEITKAILNQTLATGEADHQTGAATGSHQDVLDMVIAFGKQSLTWCLERDLLRPLVLYNFGEDAAASYTPKVSLSEGADHDFATDATAVSSLMSSGYLHDSQFVGLDARLGLPERDMEAMQAEKEQGLAMQQMALQAKMKPGGNDKEDGNDKETGGDKQDE